MVWTIARREVVDQLTSPRFLIVTLLVIGLTPLTVYVGSRDYANRLADYSRLAADKQKLAAATKAVSRAGPVLRAIRAPEPLSVLVRGLDGALPEYWDFSEGGAVEGPLATLVAQAVVPVPPPQAVEQKKQALGTDLKRELDRAMGRTLLELTGQPVDNPKFRLSWADVTQHRAELEARATTYRRTYASKRRQFLGEVERDADRRADRQNRLARIIMALSPAATFAGTATDLAGTGDAHREAWVSAVRRHQGELEPVLFDDPPIMTFSHSVGGSSQSSSSNWRQEPTLSELPPFSGPRQEAVAAIDAALPGLGLLALYVALFVAGGFWAFARYDVR